MLEFIVDDNTVLRKYETRPDHYKVPMHSQNAIEVLFEFDETWNGYTTTAQLTKLQSTYNLLLDANNKILIPSDITEGLWYISVFGVKGSITRNTTISACINVVRGGYVTSGTPPVPPTPDLYQQLISQIETSETNAKASEVAAAQSLQDVNVASAAAISKMETYGDTRYANALVGNKSGTLVNVDDAWGVNALKVGVDGKAAQVVTAGKNICPVKSGTSSGSSGITATANSDGSITLNGTATSAGYITLDGGYYDAKVPIAGSLVQVDKKYCMSGGIASKVDVRLVTYSETGNGTTIIGSGTVPATDLYYGMFLYTYAGASFANTVVYPQIEQAEVATVWEPYTGGEPSPSPDYPQEVDVVDSPVSVQVVGKNLLEIAITLPATSNGVTLTQSGSVFTASGTAVGYPFWVLGNVYLIAGVTYYLQCVGVSGTQPRMVYKGVIQCYGQGSFTPTKTGLYRIDIYASNTHNGTTVLSDVMLSVGTTATTYEPYTSNQQTIILPSDHNYLASLPDGTRDELVLRADGVAVLTERLKLKTVDSTNNVLYMQGSTSEIDGVSYAQVSASFNDIKIKTINTSYVLSNRFKQARSFDIANSVVHASSAAMLFRIKDADITTKNSAGVLDWFTRNSTIVCYELASEKTLYSADNGATWSTTDPAAGNSAIQLYKGTNNIWCTDALGPNTNLEYVQDTNAVIKKLSAAIVAAGSTGV